MPVPPVPAPCAHPRIPRRGFLAQCALLALAGGPALAAQPRRPRPASGPTVQVYKDPGCGCCTAWVAHLRDAGLAVTVHDTPDMDGVKANFGIPAALASCHTARVGRYVVEGHVPADLITRLLREQPAARGLAVPGMPVGSPGMEGPSPERYAVLLFDAAGRTRVYATRG